MHLELPEVLRHQKRSDSLKGELNCLTPTYPYPYLTYPLLVAKLCTQKYLRCWDAESESRKGNNGREGYGSWTVLDLHLPIPPPTINLTYPFLVAKICTQKHQRCWDAKPESQKCNQGGEWYSSWTVLTPTYLTPSHHLTYPLLVAKICTQKYQRRWDAKPERQ